MWLPFVDEGFPPPAVQAGFSGAKLVISSGGKLHSRASSGIVEEMLAIWNCVW